VAPVLAGGVDGDRRTPLDVDFELTPVDGHPAAGTVRDVPADRVPVSSDADRRIADAPTSPGDLLLFVEESPRLPVVLVVGMRALLGVKFDQRAVYLTVRSTEADL
jgi:hypothetical protein